MIPPYIDPGEDFGKRGKSRKPDVRAPEQDLQIILGRIRWHARRLEKPGISANEKLMRLRLISRAAQDEYDRTLAELDSLNSVMADPALHLPIAGGVD